MERGQWTVERGQCSPRGGGVSSRGALCAACVGRHAAARGGRLARLRKGGECTPSAAMCRGDVPENFVKETHLDGTVQYARHGIMNPEQRWCFGKGNIVKR